ncbi:MAG: FAD-dependent oxidoreductase [Afipia sp.]|nr:FAD-dependent oxidoreductase [Afipia sp.]
MSDVIVIGGGLSGLSAAWELERLGIAYTLIEVKPRLGGSIQTERVDGFVIDHGPFVLEKYGDWPFLPELGLQNNLTAIGRYRDGELVIFAAGTQTLVDALASRLTAPRMLRMAVSSLGAIDGQRYGICLENGVMLEARAIVIAVPARYADHMLRTVAPEAALRLSDYRYDPVVRVHLAFRRQDLPRDLPIPTGGLFKFAEAYVLPDRVPPDHALVRVGVRLNIDPAVATPEQALAAARRYFDVEPILARAHYWSEADPLTCYLPEHSANMDTVDTALPTGIALVGSDYRARRLPDRVEQGRAAARKIVDAL